MKFLGPLLAEGALRAAACLNDSGRLVDVPPEVWRKSPRLSNPYMHMGPVPESMLEAALDGAVVEVPFDGWSALPGRPVLSLRALATALGAEKPPPPPAILPVATGEKPLPSPAVTAPMLARGGGRNPRHDWDEFWIEVAIFMAHNGQDKQDRPRLQKQMEEWTAHNWVEPPDPATIRRRLQKLYGVARNRA